MIIYISGKYTTGDINENIAEARKVAIQLWGNGFTVICPHLNTANFEKDCKATYDDYIKGDLDILTKCDVILMLPSWNESNGAKIEMEYALDNNIPVFIWVNIHKFKKDITRYTSDVEYEYLIEDKKLGIKYDDKKLRWDLVELNLLEEFVNEDEKGFSILINELWKHYCR